ncbi:fimbrial protein [Ursidibacter arcticus]
MKKLSILSVALLVAGVANANTNTAYDGQITFNGKIVDQTCSVTNNTKNLTVNLPTVSKSAFTKLGDTAGSTGFTITLEGCKHSGTQPYNANQNGSTVRLYFLPTLTATQPSSNLSTAQLVNVANNVLLNKATQTVATNVGIQILDSALTPIPLGKDINGYTQQTDKVALSGNVALNYNARYYALANDVSAGNVQASVQYNIVYD